MQKESQLRYDRSCRKYNRMARHENMLTEKENRLAKKNGGLIYSYIRPSKAFSSCDYNLGKEENFNESME